MIGKQDEIAKHCQKEKKNPKPQIPKTNKPKQSVSHLSLNALSCYGPMKESPVAKIFL